MYSQKEEKEIRPHVYRALDGTPAARILNEGAKSRYDRYALFRRGWNSTDKMIRSKDIISSPDYKSFSMVVFHNTSHFFSDRNPFLVQILLSMLIGHPVFLTGIETENKNEDGNPEWFFYYRTPTWGESEVMKAFF